jgi:hypothetical protein
MIIPPIRWGDIILRSDDPRQVNLSEREQYLLQMLLSWSQMNSISFISDYADYPAADINQFIDETMNSLLRETIPPYESYAMYPINAFVRNFDASSGTWSKVSADFMTFRQVWQNTNVANGRLTQKVFLTAGDWNFRLLYAKSTTSGVWHIKLNDSESFQWISSSLNLNGLFNAEFVHDVTLTVPRTEQCEIEIFNQGTTTSGGHQGQFTSIHMWQS